MDVSVSTQTVESSIAAKLAGLRPPSAEVRDKLRPKYGEDATDLIASSQVIATNFQTVAAANNYWRD